MTEPRYRTAEILAQLEHVDQQRPAEELATYEHVLAQLTELLNAPEEHGPGGV
ncbi:MAG: hypothetical protein GX920_02865 [Micrococcus sp.]|nr:hypothetical protein [Micrococcus sp.]